MILFFNVPSTSIQDGLEPGPELLAGLFDEGLTEVVPLLLHRGPEGVKTVVGSSTGPGLQNAPDSIIQWIKIWGCQRPKVRGPEIFEVGLAPLLDSLGCVARSSILLPHIVAVGIVGIDPGLDNLLHDLQVLLEPSPHTFGEPEDGYFAAA